MSWIPTAQRDPYEAMRRAAQWQGPNDEGKKLVLFSITLPPAGPFAPSGERFQAAYYGSYKYHELVQSGAWQEVDVESL